ADSITASFAGMTKGTSAGMPIRGPVGSGRLQDAQLLERGDPVVEADFLCNLAVLYPEDGRSSEPHLSSGGSRKGADKEVAAGGPGVRAATFPTADHVVALGDQFGRAPEVEVRERLAESHHEVPYVFTTSTRCVQRILEEDIGCSEFVDDPRIPRITPK